MYLIRNLIPFLRFALAVWQDQRQGRDTGGDAPPPPKDD